MNETITITAKSELKVSKNKRTYFTIGDEKDRTFVCFKPALHSELEVGTTASIDFSEPAKEGDSYRLNDVAKEGKFAPRPETGSPQGKKYGRDEDRVDQRTFVMETGQDLRAGLIDKKHPFFKAREAIMTSWVRLQVDETARFEPKPETPKLTLIDIDEMNWLSESIKKIWKTYKAFVQFLGERYSVAMDGSVKDVLDRLSEKQQAELLKEIENRLNKTS